MSKVLVIGFPGEGHINPTLAIVEELIRRGETVVYYCIEQYRNKIEKTRASFRPYEDFTSQIDIMKKIDEGHNPLEMIYRIVNVADKIVPTILKEIKEESYDYVIYDNNFIVGVMIANVLRLPKISSCTTFAFNHHMSFGSTSKLNEITKSSPMYQVCLDTMQKWEKQYNIVCNSLFDIMNQPGDITIVFTSKLYQPRAELFDDSFIFVGPSISPRKDVSHFPIEKLKTERVIFISMGTVFNQQPKFYETCFEAFQDMEATFVLAVGKKTDISQFKNIPSNFLVYNYVSQLEVLQHTNVFITHGGMNSSSEGLYFGVPLVVIPVAGDQPIVAKRVEELGAGIQLDRLQLTAKMLCEATEQVLNNKEFSQNSHTIGKSLKEAGGYKKAVDAIFNFKKRFV
ncbi:macrolide family glycosyltransferase [Bacillus sp. CGMCC 1.60114]|uniref:macrolide family glycosyltransferase n=1 Tax=unclassified Bacillus (in: firmicutes) TaxID=185979 RepID=UPI0036414900